MNFCFENKIDFKIVKNSLNKGFLPKGMFWNIPKVKHNNIWYNCSIRFEENTLILSSLILHKPNSCIVKEHIEGDFYKVKVNKFQKNLILYLYNIHPLNYKLFYFKKNIVERKKTIFVFTIAILISMIYYISNIYFDNRIMIWISNNLLAQTIIIFLTLSGFINIFTPFTIQKEITKKDIEEISSEKIIEQHKIDEENKIIKDRASF